MGGDTSYVGGDAPAGYGGMPRIECRGNLQRVVFYCFFPQAIKGASRIALVEDPLRSALVKFRNDMVEVRCMSETVMSYGVVFTVIVEQQFRCRRPRTVRQLRIATDNYGLSNNCHNGVLCRT